MRLVAMSDTHGYHKRLTVPDGDFLIHVGDFSMRANRPAVCEFSRWFKALPHKHKIIVAGNHDVCLDGDRSWAQEEFAPAHYLVHEAATIGGLKIFGSPYSSSIFEPSPWAFDYDPTGPRSEALWSIIPKNLDILITHGPPKGVLDYVKMVNEGEEPHVGDVNLLYYVKQTKPKVHLFGHIHEGYGAYQPRWSTTKFYNVSVCDVGYKPVNPITVFDL